jgi:type IV secretory pathway VirB6-like protein
MNSTDFGSIFANINSAITIALAASSTALVGEGRDLAGVLLLITVSWSLLTWMLSGDGVTALVESFQNMTRYAVVILLLTTWTSTITGFFGSNIDSIGRTLTGSYNSQAAFNSMFKAASRMFSKEEVGGATELNCRNEMLPDASGSGSIPTRVCDPAPGSSGSGENSASWTDLLLYFPSIMYGMMLKLVAVIFLGLMMVAYLLAIFMSQALFGIGMSLGPILVPWLIWQRTEFLFDGWLKFMIIAAMTKLVAALMISMVTGIIVALTSLSVAVDSSPMGLAKVDMAVAYIIAIVAAIGAFMMWQVQGIAQALISGGAGVGSKTFGTGSVSRAVKNSAASAVAKVTK